MPFPPDKRYAGTRSSQKVAESSGPAPHPPLQRAIGLANRAGALTRLLSKVAEGVGNAPTPGLNPVWVSKPVQPAYICLPSIKFGDPDGIRPHDLLLERQAC